MSKFRAHFAPIGRFLALSDQSFLFLIRNLYKSATIDKQYRAHMNNHFKINPIECDLCDKRFGTKSQLNYHVQRDHDGIRITCPICKNTFSNGWKSHAYLICLFTVLRARFNLPKARWMWLKHIWSAFIMSARQNSASWCESSPKKNLKSLTCIIMWNTHTRLHHGNSLSSGTPWLRAWQKKPYLVYFPIVFKSLQWKRMKTYIFSDEDWSVTKGTIWI